MTVVTGVSGSGKTTLILESLIPGLEAAIAGRKLPAHVLAVNPAGIRQVKLIDATPIGINVRSTVATYANVHDELRKLYAATPDAKKLGYKAGDFSYNTGKLRCPGCDGTGTISLDVQFLPDVEIPCPDCHGEGTVIDHPCETCDGQGRTPSHEKIDIDIPAGVSTGRQLRVSGFGEAGLRGEPSGDLIVNVVGELKGFDAEEEKGFLGFFRKQANKLEVMKSRYAKAEVNVEKIGDALQQHQVRLLKDSAMLDKMYEQNLAYFKELTMYILAGKKKLQEVREGKLKELEATARATGLAEDAQAAKDLADKCNRFEKKIYDLELTRTISIQTAPQIRMIQNNDNVMVEKIQTTLMNTIPLWKNQMVLALGIAHSNEAAQAQRQVNDITNALLKQNAEKLHMASVETAKEAERGIVDIETLKKTNAELIQTLDDVMKIQSEGREKRIAAEAEMAKMENDLKGKLLEIRGGV